MSKLTWDRVGERLYETGVDRGVLYRFSNNEFTNGVAWNGLTAVNESPSGAEATAVYADNVKYLNLLSAEQYGATIEAYAFPEEFQECDGANNGIRGLAIRQQRRKLFGFSYRTLIGNDVQGVDYGYKIHLVYNCLASPSGKDHSTTNDSPEATTLSWELSTTSVTITNGKPTCILEIDSSKCDEDSLRVLEEILYGTEDTPPRLPYPDEALDIIGNIKVVMEVTEISDGDYAFGFTVVSDPDSNIWISATAEQIEGDDYNLIFTEGSKTASSFRTVKPVPIPGSNGDYALVFKQFN